MHLSRSRPSGSTPTLRLYIRRSLDADAQAASLDTQRAASRRRAEQEGWPWVDREEYVDDDRSGGDSLGREEWTRLLAEAKPDDVVLAYNRDRLSREDPIDAARVVRDLCRRGVRVVYADGTEETFKSAIDSVVAVLRGFGAAHELERIKSRVRDALRERVRDGYAAAAVPFGYATVADEATRRERRDGTFAWKKRVILDPERAAIVVRVFTEYAAGRGLKAIAVGLNNDLVPPPAGRVWRVPAIWNMLRREQYRGVVIFGTSKTERRGGKTLRLPADIPVLRVERPELRIVELELWQAVQERIATRKAVPGKSRAVKYPLVGVAKCGLCRGPLISNISHKGDKVRRFYSCWQHKVSGNHGCTVTRRFPGEAIERAVFDYVRAEILPFAKEAISATIREEIAERAKRSEAIDTTALASKIDDLKREKQRAIKLAVATDGDADVAAHLRALSEEITSLERNLAAATVSTDDLVLRRVEARALARLDVLAEAWKPEAQGAAARDALRMVAPILSVSGEPDGSILIEGEATVGALLDSDPTASR